MGKAAEGEFVRYETSHLAADGSLHYIDFSIKPAMDESGRVVLLIPEGRDITARKRVEEAVRNSEAKFKALFENSSRLIDNVRKLQKVKAGDTTSKEMDIGQVLTDVIYQYTQKHSGIAINYIPVIGHVARANELLYDVFSNLVGNAIKHSNGPPLISIIQEKVWEEGRVPGDRSRGSRFVVMLPTFDA